MGAYVRERYHGIMPPWRTTRNAARGQLAGIELEIEHGGGYNRILQALPDTPNSKLRPCTETDASIDNRTGVEIIFPPYKYSTIKSGASFITKAVAALRDEGCRVGERCGMHVNINTNGWPKRVKALFVAAINGLSDVTLRNIGGRELNGYCRQISTAIYSPNRMLHLCQGSHHSATSVRTNRVELRFPVATTSIDNIRKIIDFAYYMEKYVRTLPADVNLDIEFASTVPDMDRAFVEFLKTQKQTKAVKKLIANVRIGHE